MCKFGDTEAEFLQQLESFFCLDHVYSAFCFGKPGTGYCSVSGRPKVHSHRPPYIKAQLQLYIIGFVLSRLVIFIHPQRCAFMQLVHKPEEAMNIKSKCIFVNTMVHLPKE